MVRGVFILRASQSVEDTNCPKQGTTRYAGDYDRRVGLLHRLGSFAPDLPFPLGEARIGGKPSKPLLERP